MAASVNWNIEKSTTLNNECLKRGIKDEKHIDFPFYLAFPTGPNSMIKTERQCAKYVQSKTKNKFCKTKCAKLNFYKCAHFVLFLLLSTPWIYHLRCFPISFHFLFHFTLILYIATLISHIFCISTQIPDQDFKKIVTLVKKPTLPFVTTA